MGYPAISRFPRTSGYLRTSRFLTTLGFSRYFGFPEDFGFSEISRVSQELWNTRQFRNRHSKFKSSQESRDSSENFGNFRKFWFPEVFEISGEFPRESSSVEEFRPVASFSVTKILAEQDWPNKSLRAALFKVAFDDRALDNPIMRYASYVVSVINKSPFVGNWFIPR